MLRRVLAVHGIALLALTMPPGLLAQLPDAPTAARAGRQAEGSLPLNLAGEDSAFRNALQHEWVNAPVVGFASDETETAETGVSSSAIDPGQVAFLPADTLEGQQQSFPPSFRGRFRPTLSSSAAYLGRVPGSAPALHNTCMAEACPVDPADICCGHISSQFAQYLKWPDVVPLTARSNLHSALKDIVDPFNLMTIGGDAAIGVASDSHSPYGPGMRGFAKYSGVSMTEDLTGEFFGTFLVPSLAHQDPHYHREPFLPIRRRALHAIVQVVWTQSYTGTPMFNYANVVGGIATAAVSNTFVPGPGRQGFGNTAERLALAFAISPSGNLIEEFLPDLASRINLRVVIFQRILNSVTLEESGVPQ